MDFILHSFYIFLKILKKDNLDILKKIRLGSISEAKLIEIYFENINNHLFLFNLVQNPSFPIRLGLEIIPKLFPAELVRVSNNKRSNPFLRKKCEKEFTGRYKKIALGERISLLKFAPGSLLTYFTEEKDERILKAIISNPKCTEDLIVRFINRKEDRYALYNILLDTNWIKQKNIAIAISYDKEVPIRVWVEIIPFLPINRLIEISNNEHIHDIVKKNVELRLRKSKFK